MTGRWPSTIAADVAVVVLFAVVGRVSHEEGLALAGVARTAWPFLLGAAAGLVLAYSAHDDPRSIRAGIRVWLLTVVVGMVLRPLIDANTAASFVVVATVVLGMLILGWRLVARPRRWTLPLRRS